MILVDTSGWYALADNRERHHDRAKAEFGRISSGELGPIITTDYVLDETYTLLRMRLGLNSVRSLRGLISRSPNTQILHVSDREFELALEMMVSHEDKRWSFTDCTTFVLMRELDLQKAFTFDRNFEEAGFQMFPAP